MRVAALLLMLAVCVCDLLTVCGCDLPPRRLTHRDAYIDTLDAIVSRSKGRVVRIGDRLVMTPEYASLAPCDTCAWWDEYRAAAGEPKP